ncbi:MAG TPA: hypothetical protein PLW14_06240 [Chlorobiota bacterium]|nr:hypothetical protein [Chlorobiota bacterium]
MKPVHDKVPVTEFTPGKTYRIRLNGAELYNAEVIKFFGGCWATVRVVEPLSEEHKDVYRPGMEFDIKVGMYEVGEE